MRKLRAHEVRAMLAATPYTVCPTRYRTRHFFYISNTNEDIAGVRSLCEKWKGMCLQCVSVVRFKFRCNILISGKIIKEMPGSVASGTLFIIVCFRVFYFKITLMAAVLYVCETRSLRVGAEHMLRVYESRMLREIIRPEMGNVTRGQRRLHNEELNDIYISWNVCRVIKLRKRRWAVHVARIRDNI